MAKNKKREDLFAPLKPTPFAMPAFASEEEEANWWDAHQEAAEDLFARAIRAGAVTRGTLQRAPAARAPATTPMTIRMFTEDLPKVRAAAARRGLRCQTFIKMVLHELVEKEDRGRPG